MRCRIKFVIGKEIKKKIYAFIFVFVLIIIGFKSNTIIKNIVDKAVVFSTAIISPQNTYFALKEKYVLGEESSDKSDKTDVDININANVNKPDVQKTESENSNSDIEQNDDLELPSNTQSVIEYSEKSSQSNSISGTDKNPQTIPKKYQAQLIEEHFTGKYDGNLFSKKGDVLIRNYTKITDEEIMDILEKPSDIKIKDITKPTVLIYHTHTTESYEKYDSDVYDTRNSWRDTDNTNNMAVVGDVLTSELEKYGINVIHDVTQHDYPSYNGSYDRSRVTMQKYLDKYPEIAITIDIHRDGIVGKNDTVKKPVAIIDGKKYAQLMIVPPCGNEEIKVPKWKENFRFATELSQYIYNENPDILRPMFLSHRFYNLDLRTGSLLFEIGSNGNTLEEATNTAKFIAKPIADYIKSLAEDKSDNIGNNNKDKK